MQTFVYKAKNSDGIPISGDIQADRRERVIQTLKSRGYYLISVDRETQLTHFLNSSRRLGSSVRLLDKAIFTHQLGTLLRAGLQLSLALKTLSKQTQNKHLAGIITQLHRDIEESSSLSGAMRKHPHVFSTVYTAIIAAAEQSGSLAETLSVMSQQLKTQHALRTRIRGAMVYPLFLLVASAIIVGVLMTFVVPKFIELFVNSNQQLPLPTKILSEVTNFIRTSWWFVLLCLTGLAGFIMVALREVRIRLFLDHVLLRLPLLGQLNQKMLMARFSRTLGSLLQGGVRILEAVKTTRGTTTNLAFSQVVFNIEDALLKGASLAKSACHEPYFSEIATNMIAVGEDTGMLPEMLIEIADMYDQDCEASIGNMTTLLGPLMIFFLGGLVGFIVIAILLPIFETSSMIG